jgi:putative transposase
MSLKTTVKADNQILSCYRIIMESIMYRALIQFLIFQFTIIKILFKSKDDLVLEIIELRQQLATYQVKKEKPKNITDTIRFYLIALKETWAKWRDALVIVTPETVIGWQQRRFKKYWTKLSNKNKKPGRPSIKLEIRALIKRMASENFTWGAPRILSELRKLGYTEKQVSQRTVSRYLKKLRPNDSDKARRKRQQWKTFLENHRKHIMAMDFFTVPTISFKILYVFFIIDHARRKIVHFNITEHPTEAWIIQQLRDAFPFDSAPKYLIFDRGFSLRVKQFIKDIGVKPKVTAYQSPWQNGVAERFVLSVRIEMLNHIIIFNEDHLRDFMKQYLNYYNNERCHLSVERDSPNGRKVEKKPSESAKIIAFPKLGGLHHAYQWEKAA